MESIKINVVIPADLENVFKFWTDSALHSAITGSSAKIDAKPGGKFTCWDGYISGSFIEIDPLKKIIQNWRTTEFPEDSPDSILELNFEKQGKKTKLTLVQTRIPDGQAEDYKQGWVDHYFDLMKGYFEDK